MQTTTHQTHCHRNIQELYESIQEHANQTTSWFRDNEMICSGEKTKLLIIGTSQNRRANGKLENPPVINVCGREIEESESEKLLGVIINNTATWKHMLYGNDDNPGLIKQLSKRVGILKRVRKYMPTNKFKMVANSMFNSKLIYCISLWGAVWKLPGVMEENVRSFTSISKEDMRKLQVLQNAVLRLQTGLGWLTPTEFLVKRSGQLSVHQLVAYHSALQVFKCRKAKQPDHMYKRFFQENDNRRSLRSVANQDIRINFKLSLSRGTFFYRASKIFNALPKDVKESRSVPIFKKALKKWIKHNISVVP